MTEAEEHAAGVVPIVAVAVVVASGTAAGFGVAVAAVDGGAPLGNDVETEGFRCGRFGLPKYVQYV